MTASAERAAPPRHLVRLGERWAAWRWVALRGAGMPVDWLSRLGRPGLAGLDEEGFAATTATLAANLHATAAKPAFQEALTWQNRHALHTGVNVLLASPGRRSSKYRQKEALVARYLQRYCAKNDTIGFFGPVGWATVRDAGPALTVRPGTGVIRSRTTYLEGWCADAVAAVVAAEPDLLQWLPPRLPPFLRLDGVQLHRPLTAPTDLAPEEAAALARCDGVRPAREIATRLASELPELFAGPEDVLAVLHRLAATHRIVWTLQVPADDPDPVSSLRAVLRPAPPGDARRRAESILDELEAHLAAVAAAAGNADRLDDALAGLEGWFSSVTGAASTRHHGQTYAGRTLVYEDCRRDLEMEIGPAMLDALGPPLEPMLASARWFTERAIVLYREELIALHRRLAARYGPRVPVENLWLYAQELLFHDGGDAFDTLADEVRQRWAAVLAACPATPGPSGPVYEPDALRDAVRSAFPATATTPGITRYCCPDVMIEAESVEAIQAGDYRLVLGELHAGFNTLTSAFFARQHPAPEDLVRAVERDLPDRQVVAVYSRDVPSRMMRGLVSPRDLRVLYAQDSCGVPPEVAVPVSALVAERAGDGLMIRSRDGQVSFESMEFFGELVMVRAHRAFGVLPAAWHTPRLTVGRLVVEREKWRVDPRELAFAWTAGERERFRAAHRWREETGIPRYAFVRTSHDAKPNMVDFDSPALLDLFCRTVRRAADDGDRVTVSEMLPDLRHAWLPDAQGRRYTCELRLVAIAPD